MGAPTLRLELLPFQGRETKPFSSGSTPVVFLRPIFLRYFTLFSKSYVRRNILEPPPLRPLRTLILNVSIVHPSLASTLTED